MSLLLLFPSVATGVIQEDPSEPANVTQLGNTSATITTASFTPANNSLLVAMVGIIWNGSGTVGAPFTVTDSLGGTWTMNSIQGASPNQAAFSGIATRVVTTGAAMTVTLTTNTAQKGKQLLVKVLTGVDLTNPIGNTVLFQSASASQLNRTCNLGTDDSVTYLSTSYDTNGTIVAAANTTIINNFKDATDGAEITAGKQTVPTTGAPTTRTLGWTGDVSAVGKTYVAVEILPVSTNIPINDSDTGSATEAQSSIAAATSGSDTSALAEASSIAATQTSSNTGALSDVATVAASVSSSDTGTTTDAGSVAAAVPGAETGAQAETSSLTASQSAADARTIADVGTVAATLSNTNTGSMAETSSILVTVSSSDTGSQSETTSIGVPINQTDTTSLTESASIVATISSSNTGTLTETSTTSATLSSSNSSALSEAQSVHAATTSADTGHLTDTGSVNVIGGFPFPEQDFTTVIQLRSFSGGVAVSQVSASSILQSTSSQAIPDATEYSATQVAASRDAAIKTIALDGGDQLTALAGTASNIGR